MRLTQTFQRTLLFLGAAFIAVSPAFSQTNFGQINGTVTDPSGIEIAGAKVVLQSLETSTERQTVTNSSATYVIPTVAPGRYSLTVTAAGFETYKVSEFPLQSAEARTADAKMVIGTVTDTIQVQGQAVAVDKTESTISTVIQKLEIVEIPLNGRVFSQLMLLSPGVAPVQVGQQGTF
jgi:hypothetical protein